MIYAVLRAVLGFLLAVLVSTILARYILPCVGKQGESGDSVPLSPTVEFFIRCFEIALVFIFVIEREYTALALLIFADLFVRRHRIAHDPVGHMLTPLCTFTVATLFAIVARAWMSEFLAILIV